MFGFLDIMKDATLQERALVIAVVILLLIAVAGGVAFFGWKSQKDAAQAGYEVSTKKERAPKNKGRKAAKMAAAAVPEASRTLDDATPALAAEVPEAAVDDAAVPRLAAPGYEGPEPSPVSSSSGPFAGGENEEESQW